MIRDARIRTRAIAVGVSGGVARPPVAGQPLCQLNGATLRPSLPERDENFGKSAE
jgi:hypothetical protein